MILLALMVNLSALSSPLFARDIEDREIRRAVLKNLIDDECPVPLFFDKELHEVEAENHWRVGHGGRKEGFDIF